MSDVQLVAAFLEDWFEKNNWFEARLERDLNVALLGRPSLGVSVVVDDPLVPGGLMAYCWTHGVVSPRAHQAPLAVLLEEGFDALRTRHPRLSNLPLRAYFA